MASKYAAVLGEHAATLVRAVIPAILLTLLSACTSIPEEPGFDEIRRLASHRLDKTVQWREEGSARVPAESLVQDLLKQPLTVDAAVQIALLRNRSLLAAYQDLGIAQADLVEATTAVNPVFSGTAAFGPSIEWEAALVQNVLNLLTLAARKQAGEASFEQTKLEVARQIIDLAAEVQTAYYTAVADTQILELWHTAVTATEAAAELAERQLQAGNLSRLDQSAHQVFYAETLLEGARAELQIRRDRERLNRLMGLWNAKDTEWRLAQRLPDVPGNLPPLDHFEAQVVENSLRLAAAKQEVRALTITVELARKYRYLTLLGIGIGTHREPDGQFTGPRVELSLPLFDRGQSRILRLQAELDTSRERLAMAATELRAAAREARNRVAATHEQVKFFENVLLPLKQTILNETQRRYDGMLAGVYDLLQAKQGQVSTGRDYIAAIRDFWLAWSDLEAILGERLIAPAPPREDESDVPPRHHDHTHGENDHEPT